MKPQQLFYGVIGAIVVFAGVGGAGYYYAYQQLNNRSTALATQLAQQSASADEIERLTKLEHQYNRDIIPLLPLIDEALPRDKKQTEILAQIQRVAGASGLFISDVSMPSPVGLPTGVSQTIKAGAVLALPISFEVSGTYTQLQKFTSDLENLNRFTNITTLAISNPDKQKPTVYSFSLNAYIKP